MEIVLAIAITTTFWAFVLKTELNLRDRKYRKTKKYLKSALEKINELENKNENLEKNVLNRDILLKQYQEEHEILIKELADSRKIRQFDKIVK